MKRLYKILFSLVLVCIFAVPVILAGCDLKANANKKTNINVLSQEQAYTLVNNACDDMHWTTTTATVQSTSDYNDEIEEDETIVDGGYTYAKMIMLIARKLLLKDDCLNTYYKTVYNEYGYYVMKINTTEEGVYMDIMDYSLSYRHDPRITEPVSRFGFYIKGLNDDSWELKGYQIEYHEDGNECFSNSMYMFNIKCNNGDAYYYDCANFGNYDDSLNIYGNDNITINDCSIFKYISVDENNHTKTELTKTDNAETLNSIIVNSIASFKTMYFVDFHNVTFVEASDIL